MRCFLLLLFFFPFAVWGQINNLVVNPSFEDYYGCPNNNGQIDSCINWFQPLSNSTTDYYNECCQQPLFTGWVGIPSNSLGFQYAKTGVAYSGFAPYQTGQIKEYLEGNLIQGLESDKQYCVEFYYSIADLGYADFIGASLSIYFSNDSVLSDINHVIPVVPQISAITINDTMDWVKISGTFTAGGGEKFITIGNFEPIIADNGIAYVYIDDVTVYLCSDTIPKPQEVKIPNVFSPNNDGVNDLFEIDGLSQGTEVNVYNRWGALIFESSSPNNYWDGRTKSGTLVPGGIYYYVVKIPGSETKKGFVELVR